MELIRYIRRIGSRSKKGQGDIESYFAILGLILAIGAITLIGVYAHSVSSGTLFPQLFFSRDIAFAVNTVYAAPGNAYYEYGREGLDKFIIGMEGQRVVISEGITEEKAEKKGLLFGYPYADDRGYKFEKEGIKRGDKGDRADKIFFQKSPFVFSAGREPERSLKMIRCPDINTKDEGWEQKSFLIGAEPSGPYKPDTKEGRILNLIGSLLYNKLGSKLGKDFEDFNEAIRKGEKINEFIGNSDVVIILNIGDYSFNPPVEPSINPPASPSINPSINPSTTPAVNPVNPGNNDYANNIKLYFSSKGDGGDASLAEKRKKLGCLILNELFSDRELDKIFDGGNVIAVNPSYVGKGYEKTLEHNRISLVIEIGNIKSGKIKSLEDIGIANKIAEGIYRGVKKYYEQ